jgi:hypothetical protein
MKRRGPQSLRICNQLAPPSVLQECNPKMLEPFSSPQNLLTCKQDHNMADRVYCFSTFLTTLCLFSMLSLTFLLEN